MRAALGCVLVVLGCGGDDGNNGPPSINTTKDNVCNVIAEVACYDLYTCCAEGEIERFLGVSDPRTADECRADVTKLCERRLATQMYSLTNNHVTFDGKTMNDCLDSLLVPEGTCATIDSMLPWTMACMATAWVGAVADGGQCDYPYECASVDSYCSTSKTCTAKPGNGQACSSAGCVTGFYCAGATCQPQVGAGGMCSSTPQCAKGLVCDFSTTPGMCIAPKDGGQPCTSNQACKSSVCTPGTCAGTGASCYRSTDCYMHCSNNNAFCSSDGNCGAGHCSITTTKLCTLATDCISGTDGSCVFPNQCLAGSCSGNIVCTDAHVTVDYCTGAINALPLH